MTRDEVITIFEKRWSEAKRSECMSVQFGRDKWPLIEQLLEEAKRAQLLRRDLIEARHRMRRLDLEGDVVDNEGANEGEIDSVQGHGCAARAAKAA